MLREKETHKYLEILETNNIKQEEMKEKNYKKISRENKKVTRNQTKLQESYKRDKYLSCPFRKILETILEVAREELKQMDLRIRKLKMMHFWTF